MLLGSTKESENQDFFERMRDSYCVACPADFVQLLHLCCFLSDLSDCVCVCLFSFTIAASASTQLSHQSYYST